MIHLKVGYAFLLILLLSRCTPSLIAPAEQVHLSQTQEQKADQPPRTVVKKQSVSEYLCKNGRSVRVQQNLESSKKTTISVTFNQRTYRLSPAVTQKAKTYSNIRWVWSEDFSGIGTLRDNRNNLLAENCIKKES